MMHWIQTLSLHVFLNRKPVQAPSASSRFISRKTAGLALSLAATLLASGCKKNCDDVDLTTPYTPGEPVDVAKLSCANQGLPPMMQAYDFAEPRLPSHYQSCSKASLAGLSEDAIFDCGVETFWEGFSDGRLKQRKNSEAVLNEAIRLNGNSENKERLSQLYNLRGALRMAMSLENGQFFYTLFANATLNKDFDASMALVPNNTFAKSFQDTMKIVVDSILNRWTSVMERTRESLDTVWSRQHQNAEHFTGAMFAVSGTYIGFPMATGIPQETVAIMEAAGCAESLAWCQQNTLHAPFARPGLTYHWAEAHARVGNRDDALYYLNQARQTPGYDNWAYKAFVENALADFEGFMSRWESAGDYKAVTFDIYANSNVGCVFCHGRH